MDVCWVVEGISLYLTLGFRALSRPPCLIGDVICTEAAKR